MKSDYTNKKTMCELDTQERQLQLIEALARHLAIELDFHYEDHDASKLIDEIEVLTTAYEMLKSEAITAPDVVREVLGRFARKSLHLG